MLIEIIDRYPANKFQRSYMDPNMTWFGRDAPDAVRGVIDATGYKVKGSAGMGEKPAQVPWVGIRRQDVSTGFDRGVYVVYLFPTDRSGAYLSLNQGVTNVLGTPRSADDNPRAAGVFELRRRRDGLRLLLEISPRFLLGEIRLQSKTTRGQQYEDGHICGIHYDREALPDEDQLVSDLSALLRLYDDYDPEMLQLTDLASQTDSTKPTPERPYLRGQEPTKPKKSPSEVDVDAWRQALERRSILHRALLDSIATAAHCGHLSYKQTTHIDLVVNQEFLIEAKSLRGDDISQARAALAQLYHYKFVYRERYINPTLIAVFDNELANDLVEFLLGCGLQVFWKIGARFSGPRQSLKAIPWLR